METQKICRPVCTFVMLRVRHGSGQSIHPIQVLHVYISQALVVVLHPISYC